MLQDRPRGEMALVSGTGYGMAHIELNIIFTVARDGYM